jgi:hypothetical protein
MFDLLCPRGRRFLALGWRQRSRQGKPVDFTDGRSESRARPLVASRRLRQSRLLLAHGC